MISSPIEQTGIKVIQKNRKKILPTQKPNRMTLTIYEDAESKWGSKMLKMVIGKTFQDERVELDGYSYRNCKFIDVTFVYKGETPYHLIDIVCIGQPGFDISSRKSLSGLVRLLEATNNLKNVKVNYINK